MCLKWVNIGINFKQIPKYEQLRGKEKTKDAGVGEVGLYEAVWYRKGMNSKSGETQGKGGKR